MPPATERPEFIRATWALFNALAADARLSACDLRVIDYFLARQPEPNSPVSLGKILLARRCRMSVRHANDCIGHLKELGYLKATEETDATGARVYLLEHHFTGYPAAFLPMESRPLFARQAAPDTDQPEADASESIGESEAVPCASVITAADSEPVAYNSQADARDDAETSATAPAPVPVPDGPVTELPITPGDTEDAAGNTSNAQAEAPVAAAAEVVPPAIPPEELSAVADPRPVDLFDIGKEEAHAPITAAPGTGDAPRGTPARQAADAGAPGRAEGDADRAAHPPQPERIAVPSAVEPAGVAVTAPQAGLRAWLDSTLNRTTPPTP